MFLIQIIVVKSQILNLHPSSILGLYIRVRSGWAGTRAGILDIATPIHYWRAQASTFDLLVEPTEGLYKYYEVRRASK